VKPHQHRVIDEKAELDARLEKLHTFLHGDLYHTLEHAEQLRLCRQAIAMREYANILGERIAAF
jgi:hypothetical protein